MKLDELTKRKIQSSIIETSMPVVPGAHLTSTPIGRESSVRILVISYFLSCHACVQSYTLVFIPCYVFILKL